MSVHALSPDADGTRRRVAHLSLCQHADRQSVGDGPVRVRLSGRVKENTKRTRRTRRRRPRTSDLFSRSCFWPCRSRCPCQAPRRTTWHTELLGTRNYLALGEVGNLLVCFLFRNRVLAIVSTNAAKIGLEFVELYSPRFDVEITNVSGRFIRKILFLFLFSLDWKPYRFDRCKIGLVVVKICTPMV